MGNYPNCNNCTNLDNTPYSKSNTENVEIIKNDSYISFHPEINQQKSEEKNINQIIDISKNSIENEKKENINESNILKNNQNNNITKEIKENDINDNNNQIKEEGRIPKKEMPSIKNENKTRNVINELAELNENDINENINNTDIMNDIKNNKKESELENNDIIDNISHKSEEGEKIKEQQENNIYNNNLVINDVNHKKSGIAYNIYNILPKNKLNQIQDNTILCHGFLEKIIKIPSKNKFIYNERFCILTKKNFCYYKSKENYLNLWKPLFSIDLKYIKKIEQTISDDKTFYFGLICIINNETRKYVDKINTFVNNNENNKEEFLIGFRSKNKELILKWIIILNYFKDNYEEK